MSKEMKKAIANFEVKGYNVEYKNYKEHNSEWAKITAPNGCEWIVTVINNESNTFRVVGKDE